MRALNSARRGGGGGRRMGRRHIYIIQILSIHGSSRRYRRGTMHQRAGYATGTGTTIPFRAINQPLHAMPTRRRCSPRGTKARALERRVVRAATPLCPRARARRRAYSATTLRARTCARGNKVKALPARSLSRHKNRGRGRSM